MKVDKADLGVVAILLAIVLMLNAGVLGAGWRWDDTQILLHAHQYSIWQDFLRPDIWQQFSPANLTPWLIFSFEVDMTLFGLDPRAFYLHQLLAITAAAAMLYLCLTLWCHRGFALAGALVFVCGLPVMLVAEQLMTRHYIEGLVFALMALYAFVFHLRTGQRWAWAASLMLYVLAITAKEVYVPLPLVLLALSETDTQKNVLKRLQSVAPFFVVTALYALWRGYMLESVSGGYVDSSEYLSPAFISEVLVAFRRFPELLAGGGAWFLLLALAVLWGGSLYQSIRQRQVPWLALVVTLVVLLPLVPLVRSPGITLADRYLLLPWAVVSFSLAWCASRVVTSVNLRAPLPVDAARALPHLMIPLVMVVSLLHAIPVRQAVAASGKEFDVQSVFLWDHDDSVAYVPSFHAVNAFWFATGMQALKQRITGEASPVAVVDELYLTQDHVRRLFSYQSDCQCMQDISDRIPDMQSQFIERLRNDVPLSLSFSYQQGYFSWRFGPWQEGSYHVVSDRLGVLPLPPTGQLRVTLEDNVPFYLRYSSPEGWMTYSELQRVVRDGAEVNWSRN